MAKAPEEMEADMVAKLKDTTGKSLPEWSKILASAKVTKHGELVKLLKTEHAVTHGYANLIVHKHLKSAASDSSSGDELVETQYAGGKTALRPIYDALVNVIQKFGADVEIAPKKGYVSLRRNKQFGLIQPSTATRLDVGINLKGEKPTARLQSSGSFDAMVSHRVRVESVAAVDSELVGWLRRAYEGA